VVPFTVFGTDNEARFWSKVRKTDTCWLWTAALTSAGYGRFKIDGKTKTAHRWLYEHLNGPLAPGLQLDHLCRIPACVRPDHLEPVTARENLYRIPNYNGTKTHCKHGHEFTPENTMKVKGGRSCRECSRTASREYQREKFGYQPRVTTHCKRGHEYTPENLALKDGRRVCIECRRAADREWKRARYVPKRQKAVASSTSADAAIVI
jgi:hypothetical protein